MNKSFLFLYFLTVFAVIPHVHRRAVDPVLCVDMLLAGSEGCQVGVRGVGRQITTLRLVVDGYRVPVLC